MAENLEELSEASEIYWDAESGTHTLVDTHEDQPRPTSSQSRPSSPICSSEFIQLIKEGLISFCPSTEPRCVHHRPIFLGPLDPLVASENYAVPERVDDSEVVDNHNFVESRIPSVDADSTSDKTRTVVSLSVDGKATKGYITFNSEGKLDNYIHIEAIRHLGLNSEEFSALIEAVTVKLDRTDIIGRIAANLYSSLPDWKKMGFQSSFMAKISEQELSATEGRMSTELTVFDAGFSNRMFSRSARLCPDQPPKMVRYKLHGTCGQFKDFITEESRYLREKVAWSELVYILDGQNYTQPLASGFEKLATDFFNGNQVHDPGYYERVAPESAGIDEQGFSPESTGIYDRESGLQIQAPTMPKKYVIKYHQSDWAHILKEEIHKTNMVLVVFLQDLIQNYELEQSAHQTKNFYSNGLVVREQAKLIQAIERDMRDGIDHTQLETKTIGKSEEASRKDLPDKLVDDNDYGSGPSAGNRTSCPMVAHALLAIEGINDQDEASRVDYNGSKLTKEYTAHNTGHSDLVQEADSVTDAIDSLRQDESTTAKTPCPKKKGKKSKNKTVQETTTSQIAGGEGSSASKSPSAALRSLVQEHEYVEETKIEPSHNTPEDNEHEPSHIAPKHDELQSSHIAPEEDELKSSHNTPGDDEDGVWSVVQSRSSRKSAKLQQAPGNVSARQNNPLQQNRGQKRKTKPRMAEQHPKFSNNQMKSNDAAEAQMAQPEHFIASQNTHTGDVKRAITFHMDPYQPLTPNPPKSPVPAIGGSQSPLTAKADRVFPPQDGGDEHSLPLSPSLITVGMPSDRQIIDGLFDNEEDISKTSNVDENENCQEALEESASKEDKLPSQVISPSSGNFSCLHKSNNQASLLQDSPTLISRNLPNSQRSASYSLVEDAIRGNHHFAAGCTTQSTENSFAEEAKADGSLAEKEHDVHLKNGENGGHDGLSVRTNNYMEPTRNMEGYVETPHNFRLPILNHGPQVSYHTYQYVDQAAGSSSNNSHGRVPANNFTPSGQPSGGGQVHGSSSAENRNNGSGIIQPSRRQATAPSQFSYSIICTYCGLQPMGGNQSTLLLCPSCDPTAGARYCCTACLLADSYYHSSMCAGWPIPDIEPTSYGGPLFPLMPNTVASAERFRQKSFSMFCSSGAFPQVFMAWAKKFNYPATASFDSSEWYKRTGDYAVFRSDATGHLQRCNPETEVIFTIKLLRDDPRKQPLVRTLNACFFQPNDLFVLFVFYLIRDLIHDEEYFETYKYTEGASVVWAEFVHQFSREFNINLAMIHSQDRAFDFNVEWLILLPMLRNLERRHPVLGQTPSPTYF